MRSFAMAGTRESTNRVVALFCDESTGHVNPMLGLAEALAAHAWEVHFFAPVGVRERVEGVGARWCHMGHEDISVRSAAEVVIRDRLGMEVPLDINSLPFRVVPATLGVLPYLLDVVPRLSPRYIVFDACAPWGSLVADILGVPAASLMTALPETMAKRDVSSKSFSAEAQEIMSATAAAIRDEFGVDFDHNHSYSMYAPYTIVTSSRAWHRNHEEFSRSQFHYWGPLVSERRWSPPAQGNDAVERLLADASLGLTGRPLFFCSLGTVTTGSAFARFGSAVQDYYQKLCRAAALLPHVAFVFAVGKAADLEEQASEEGLSRVSKLFGEPVPSNVVVARAIDQPRMLARANGFLTHCGQNSASEAMMADVPLVVAPFQGDQIPNALRFLELGCGLVQSFHADLNSVSGWAPDLSLVTPEALAKKMRQVLEDPSFADAMRQLRARQNAEVCDQTMAEKLEGLVGYADKRAKELQPRLHAGWPRCGSRQSTAGA